MVSLLGLIGWSQIKLDFYFRPKKNPVPKLKTIFSFKEPPTVALMKKFCGSFVQRYPPLITGIGLKISPLIKKLLDPV